MWRGRETPPYIRASQPGRYVTLNPSLSAPRRKRGADRLERGRLGEDSRMRCSSPSLPVTTANVVAGFPPGGDLQEKFQARVLLDLQPFLRDERTLGIAAGCARLSVSRSTPR